MFKSLLTLFILSLLLTSDAFAQNAAGNPGWWKGVDTPAFAGGVIRQAYCDVIFYMEEGNLGGMLMAVAGVLAMATAAFGNFKHAATAAAVGIASFTMSAMVSLYFGQLCDGNGGAKGVNGALQGVDGNPGAAANIARTLSGEETTQTNNFDSAALAIASGKDADFSNQVDIQETDEDLEFDPGADEFTDGF